LQHFLYASSALRENADCVITLFPQLGLVAAIMLIVKNRYATKLVAWDFNLGSLPGGWKRFIVSRILRRVDRFIVHASAERDSYSRWLGIDRERFLFVPLQRGAIDSFPPPSPREPFIISMGSANRDYRTLVDAVAGTGINLVLIAKKDILDTLPDLPNVEKLHGLTLAECNDLLARAEISIVPTQDTETAAGQVTFTTSMRMGVATIATRSVGSVDYIRDGETGILVSPGNTAELTNAILKLWNDAALRKRIANEGKVYADEFLSDEAAGRTLGRIMDEVLQN